MIRRYREKKGGTDISLATNPNSEVANAPNSLSRLDQMRSSGKTRHSAHQFISHNQFMLLPTEYNLRTAVEFRNNIQNTYGVQDTYLYD